VVSGEWCVVSGESGIGNREWGMGNGKWGMRNGDRGTGNVEFKEARMFSNVVLSYCSIPRRQMANKVNRDGEWE
jgi:hypothetical protein